VLAISDVSADALDTLTWRAIHATGSPPAPRGGHSCCVIGNNLIVWGGYGGDTFFNDMSMLSLDSMSWQKVATFGDPPCPRAGHTASILSDNRYVNECAVVVNLYYSFNFWGRQRSPAFQ